MGLLVSLITVAEGSAYASFVEPWRAAITEMSRKPDEIVIVIGDKDAAGIQDYDWSDIPTKIVTLHEPFSNAYFNAAVCAASSGWISFCGIDDLMLPNAYIGIDDSSDIAVGTVLLDNIRAWRGSWNPEHMQHFNPLPAHSLFKKDLWIQVGGYPDIRWSDWGFWLKCATTNPTVSYAENPLAIFNTGQGRETMSGVSLDPLIRMQADLELQAFRDSLQ